MAKRAAADGVLSTVKSCNVHWPLEVVDVGRDRTETIAGQIELCQCQDLTHRLWEYAQTIVRKVQALQLGKSVENI